VHQAVQEAVQEAVQAAVDEGIKFDVRANLYTLIAITGGRIKKLLPAVLVPRAGTSRWCTKTIRAPSKCRFSESMSLPAAFVQ
jgi:hypothetical protein